MKNKISELISVLTGMIILNLGIIDYQYLNPNYPLLSYITLVLCTITGFAWMLYGFGAFDNGE
jgi:hypothetical protein